MLELLLFCGPFAAAAVWWLVREVCVRVRVARVYGEQYSEYEMVRRADVDKQKLVADTTAVTVEALRKQNDDMKVSLAKMEKMAAAAAPPVPKPDVKPKQSSHEQGKTSTTYSTRYGTGGASDTDLKTMDVGRPADFSSYKPPVDNEFTIEYPPHFLTQFEARRQQLHTERGSLFECKQGLLDLIIAEDRGLTANEEVLLERINTAWKKIERDIRRNEEQLQRVGAETDKARRAKARPKTRRRTRGMNAAS